MKLKLLAINKKINKISSKYYKKTAKLKVLYKNCSVYFDFVWRNARRAS